MSEHRWPIHPRAGRVDALCLCLVVLCGALLLAGCAGPSAERGVRSAASANQPPLLPVPNSALEFSSSALSTQHSALQSAVINPQPRNIVVSWTRNDSQPGTRTEVWASPTLAPWQPVLITNVASESVVLPMAEQMYFIVRNRNGELVSEWNKP